ncbi:MAG TPA: aminoacyl-tRNA hydrolase, partial [Thermodesulfobacteriota bacterium]|nr:aminoacyl-tRNA hydrolase [Thermodesulfobacteriota bacterium]
RVRVGIGKPVQKSEVIDHVLSQFEKEEKKLVKDAIVKAADAVIEIVQRGAESAMNKFNKNPK